MIAKKRKTTGRKKPPSPLTGISARFVRYWTDSLRETEHATASPGGLLADGLEMPSADAVRGICNQHCLETLLTRKQQRRNERAKGRPVSDDKNPFPIAVILCPLRFIKAERGPGQRFLELLWLPATLLPDGTLLPSQKGGPWIPRANLEPLLDDEAVTIGTVESVAHFAEKNPFEHFARWGDYWNYCDRLVRAVTGEAIASLEFEDYRRRDHTFIGLYSSGSSLLRLFDDVAAGERPLGLLPLFASLNEPRHEVYSTSVRKLALAASRHCGQFGNAFPLAPSQRMAVHRFFETRKNDFLCVSGPPGTGKTTLLQSIVASLWVESAARRAARPPVIIASGATNQSVTNIIDSFEKAGDSGDLFTRRWLPGIGSFGTFCCALSRVEEAEKYQCELPNGDGWSARLETRNYLAEARRQYLENFFNWSKQRFTLPRIVRHLRALIATQQRLLRRDIFRGKRRGLFGALCSLFDGKPAANWSELFAALSAYDTRERYISFWLATHYWEARWLLEAESGLKSKPEGRRQFRGDVEDWQRRAMITPIFVSTLSMAPRFFSGKKGQTRPPVDLLIFDEAGQIPVEMGAACSCLAKKAVIVGDCEQLEPVLTVPPYIDRANAAEQGLIKLRDSAGWEKLLRLGLASSSGSFMYRALRTTRWIEQGLGPQSRSSYGVTLTEHRRCVPEIVRFLNKLSYNERLEPCRPELQSRVLPPFGYMHVEGFSLQEGQSRYNLAEVEQLTAWLAAKEEELRHFYSVSSLEDIIAVITPFAAQTRRLERSLRKRYPGMTIGTVHSLQGAERRIVLFSSVYDPTFTAQYFFDRGRNMLNVAVSRAQDSFVVFGNMNLFDPEKDSPSGVLAGFLFSNPAYELLPVQPSRSAVSKAETDRIDTLDGHREALYQAFEQARREVFIVSPTISESAIRQDKIPQAISLARRRGVLVRVFTDSYLDMERTSPVASGDSSVAPEGLKLKDRAEAGRRLLEEAGAEVVVVSGNP
jgi:hypothetical protein